MALNQKRGGRGTSAKAPRLVAPRKQIAPEKDTPRRKRWPAGFPEPVRLAHERGLVVIPRPSNGRLWIDWKEYQTRRPTRAELIRWFEEFHGRDPSGMWQVLCGLPDGICVLDLDTKRGQRGMETLARLGLSPTVETPSGGAHLWVKSPGYPVRTRSRVDGYPGMELLGERHLATFYGHRHDGEYRFHPGGGRYEVSELPPDLQELFQKEAQKPPPIVLPVDIPEGFADFVPAKRLLEQALGRVQDGHGRHDTAIWLGLRLCDERIVEKEALAQKVMFKFADAVQGVKEGDVFTRHESFSVLHWCLAQPRRPPSRLWMLAYRDTDGGNARRLVAVCADDLRYCVPRKRWLVWDGRRWKEDDTLEVERRAKDIVQRMFEDASRLTSKEQRDRMLSWGRRSDSRGRYEAMVALARSEPGIPVLAEELDRDPWALNVLNGTLDLRTGELRPHRRGDLITKLAPVAYDSGVEPTRWFRFLERVVPDATDRAFLQRAIGYSLTGDTREEVLFLLDGRGANGKSTLLETICALLGDYAQAAPEGLLEAKRRDPSAASPDEARLPGKRFVTLIETSEGGQLRENSIKSLISGERRTARALYQDPFEFDPVAKFWVATNHLPIIRGSDEGIWRRLRRAPFEVHIPKDERDPHLKAKLRRRSELSGILNWAIAGLRAWRKEGLGEPRHVIRATKAYREEQDVFGSFLDECCDVGEGEWDTAATLYSTYVGWCERNRYRPMTQVSFGRKLRERGFRPRKQTHGNVRTWQGVGVR